MSRESQQLARSLAPLVKAAGRKLGIGGTLALVAAGALYLLLLQPFVEKQFGLHLPTLADVVSTDVPPIDVPSTDGAPKSPRPPREEGAPRLDPPGVDAGDLGEVLTEAGRDTYRSEAGLRYTRGSQHGTRLAHLAAHTRDEPHRDGSHGVFDPGDLPTVVRLVDEAYTQALTGRKTRTEREGDQTVYTVDLGRRIGYVGGESGARRNHPPATHLRLVVQGDRFITAFPLRP